MNLYGFVGNNPVKRIDLFGLFVGAGENPIADTVLGDKYSGSYVPWFPDTSGPATGYVPYVGNMPGLDVALAGLYSGGNDANAQTAIQNQLGAEKAGGAAAGISALLSIPSMLDPFLAPEMGLSTCPASNFGDLSHSEIQAIQSVVNQAGRPLEVVGSAARGTRTAASDIDYVIPPSSLPYFNGLESQLPSIDPNHGIIPGVGNPNIGPSIHFEPMEFP